jgi:hypothetical protein
MKTIHYVKHREIPMDSFGGKDLARCISGEVFRYHLALETLADGRHILCSFVSPVFSKPDSGEVITASSPEESLGQEIVDKIVVVAPKSSLGKQGFHFAVIEGSLTIQQCKSDEC